MRETIEDIRRRIEVIDHEILRLMANRTAAAAEMGQLKAGSALPLRNLAVEEKVIERYVTRAREFGMSVQTATQIASLLLHESIELQARIPRPARQRKILIIGGSGKMGAWFCRYFASRGHKIRVYDPTESFQFPMERDLEKGVGEAEVIVLACPVSHTGEMLERVIALRPSGLLFDIASIKTPIIPSLKKAAKEGLLVCSLHPMFGPNTDSIIDRNVIICNCGNQKAVEQATALVEGSRTMTMDVEEHDPLIAYVLGLSHSVNIAFAAALSKSGKDFTTLTQAASTTFRRQSDTARDVIADNPQLYYEIQHLNPFNKEALDRLREAVEELKEAVESEDSERFKRIMEASIAYFGGK